MNIETKTYKKITPANEGNLLTSYKEGDDISTYESVLVMYVPSDFDTSTIKEITKAEDKELKNKRDLAIKSRTN